MNTNPLLPQLLGVDCVHLEEMQLFVTSAASLTQGLAAHLEHTGMLSIPVPGSGLGVLGVYGTGCELAPAGVM